MKKRILSLSLIISMVISLLPLSAYAANFRVYTENGIIFRIYDLYDSYSDSDYQYYSDKIGKAVLYDLDENAGGDLIVPSEVQGYKVYVEPSLGMEGPFGGKSNIETLTLPEGITTIGAHSFAHCKNLRAIYIPKTVTYIDERAFFGNYMSTGGFTSVLPKQSLTDIYFGGCEEEWNYDDSRYREMVGDYYNLTIHFNATGIGTGTTSNNEPQNKGYYISVYPQSGYANISDNDGTGTRFEFTIHTSRDIDENEIAIRADKINHTEWHYITPEYFEDFDYGDDALTGQKRWVFYLHMNNSNNSDDRRVIELVLNGEPTGITTTLNVMPQQVPTTPSYGGNFSPTPQQGSFSPTPQQGEISVFVCGQKVDFDVQPQIINDRTMVPVRAIFESLGATVTWEPETQRVVAEKWYEPTQGTVFAIFEIGSNIMMNSFGETYDYIDTPAMIIDGRTLVPARAAAEAFNYNVEWDEATKTVYIY